MFFNNAYNGHADSYDRYDNWRSVGSKDVSIVHCVYVNLLLKLNLDQFLFFKIHSL